MFKGKVALVTGAASGIGRSVAQLFAEQGAKVVVTDIDVEGGQETVELIEYKKGEAMFEKVDVSSPEDCERMVQKSLATYGRLDCACNNAGIPGEENPIADYSIGGWQKLISISLSGGFLLHEI
jgi:NAD(P)-dependent dehydrogenase (short-subunit alcohol dehydrogenase family)